MCGIFGAINGDIDKLVTIGCLAKERGHQATGLFDDKGIIKDAVDSTIFFGEKETKQFLKRDSKFVVGHTRFATFGTNTKDNAHPFVYDHITGAHNGVINNHWDLGQYAVDSQAFFDGYSKKGSKILSKLQGYWIFFWYDLTQPEYLFFTQHANEVYFVKHGKSIYFSNELKHLNVIFDKKPVYYNEDEIIGIHLETLKFKSFGKYKPKQYVPLSSELAITNNTDFDWGADYGYEWDKKDYLDESSRVLRKDDFFPECCICAEKTGTIETDLGDLVCDNCAKEFKDYVTLKGDDKKWKN